MITIVLTEIAQLLKTGLDRDTLGTCVRLIEEHDANPEALAALMVELERDVGAGH